MNISKVLLLFQSLSIFLSCMGQTARTVPPIDTVALKIVGDLLCEGCLFRDTLKLQRSLQLSDSLLRLGYTGQAASSLYHYRTTAYLSLGDIDKGLENMEKFVSYSPVNSTLRMSYRHVKAIASHDADEERRALNANLAICDSVLSKSYKFEYAYAKLQFLYFLYGKQKSLQYLSSLKKQHPSSFLPSSKKEWDKFCAELDAERKHLYDMRTTRNGFYDSVY